MLDRAQGGCPCLVELAREIEGPRQPAERRDERFIHDRLGKGDGAVTFEHCLTDILIRGGGTHHRAHALNVRSEATRVLDL